MTAKTERVPAVLAGKADSAVTCRDCLAVLPTLPENSVDAIVTDPPYGLGFMGKDWDHGIPGVAFWQAAFRVAKPGAHLLAFGGMRTFHRLACAVEDAGWEIRDTVMWVYGSGFPKSLDVSKAIDKAAGAKRKRHRDVRSGVTQSCYAQDAWTKADKGTVLDGTAITPAAKQWDGWGTALKPAWEPIIVARKPLDGTVAANVQKHGTGALNIDGCRIASGTEHMRGQVKYSSGGVLHDMRGKRDFVATDSPLGRWPANLIHDGSDEATAGFPKQKSPAPYAKSTDDPTSPRCLPGTIRKKGDIVPGFGDSGSAARFFYCAKASKKDRDEGLENRPKRTGGECTDRRDGTKGLNSPRAGAGRTSGARNHHPTVKPTALMRYLCRLVTPPGGLVLDPFAGSGSTGKAARLEGFRFLGIELDPGYAEIARERVASTPKPLFPGAG